MKTSLEPANGAEPRTLVDALLREQSSLTAVERFARSHEQHGSPAQEKFYRDLIPLTAPAPGEQYAFEVDLDKCSGCKACVTACHARNGLDEEETWRSVGLLYSDDWRAPFQATVTTACHHCVDPGCLSGCPVLAYDKDPATGIVRHLDDQCIGCQYCVMKCPYEVPQYSTKRGIVRKCDMCSNRLSQGEAPACVQACPSVAIRITIVDQKKITAQYRDDSHTTKSTALANLFLPASPAPQLTLPTTRYLSKRELPDTLRGGDHARVSKAHAHFPLVFMLVLSQLSVGCSVAALLLNPARWLALTAAVSGAIGVGMGTLHLGQPLKAWRAFLGWRTSWFSREVIVFGAYVPLAMSNAAAWWLTPLAPFKSELALPTAIAGFLGVACSAMIYADTRREFWAAPPTFAKFFSTTLLLGAGAALCVGFQHLALIAVVMCFITIFKLALEQRIFRHLLDENETITLRPLNKTARLLANEMGVAMRLRMVCGIVGGIFLPLAVGLNSNSTTASTHLLALIALLFCIAGELWERYFFFTAVAPATMPGGALS